MKFNVGDTVTPCNEVNVWRILNHAHLAPDARFTVLRVQDTPCVRCAAHEQQLLLAGIRLEPDGRIVDGWASGYWFDPEAADHHTRAAECTCIGKCEAPHD